MADRDRVVGIGRQKEQKELEYRVETITPQMAQEWLALNAHNRNASKARVRAYARDMARGHWPYTGDPIRFNGNGELIDGQQRLMAVVESGKSLQALVIRGLPVEVRENLDQGRSRTAADHLVLRGFATGTQLAAALRQLYRLRTPAAKVGGGSGGLTNAEVLEAIEKHPQMADSVEAVGRPAHVQPSLLAAMHYIGANLLNDRDHADAFVAVLTTGKPAYDGDPAQLWRERLIDQSSKKERLTRAGLRIGTAHAWNLFRKREQLDRFRLPKDAVIEGLDPDRI